MYTNKINSLVVFYIVSLIITISLIQPNMTYADSNQEEAVDLYYTNQVVEIDEGISILKNTYLYGREIKDGVEIQFAGHKKIISLEKLDKVNDSENTPRYNTVGLGEGKKESLALGDKVIDIESNQILEITRENEYQIYHQSSGEKVIYIGGIEYYISDETNGEIDPNEGKNKEENINQENDSEELDLEGNLDSNSKPKEGDNDSNLDSNPKPKEEINNIDNNDIETKKEVEQSASEEDAESKSKQSNTQIINDHNTSETTRSTLTSDDPWEGISSNYFKVVTDNLVVYDNRGSGPLKPVGTLKKGQVYPIISDYGNWHRIQYGDIFGYVRKNDTVPDNGSSLKNKNTSYQNQDRKFQALNDLIVYDNSSGSLVPFGRINEEQMYPIATDYGNWWRVILSDRVGYVRKNEAQAEFQSGDKYFRVYKDNLPVYDNRSGSLKKIGELKKGESYLIVSNYGSWWRVQYGDIYGYVRKSDTGYTSGTEIKNENTNYTNSSHKFKANQQVKVYDNTSGSLVSFGEISKDTHYSISGDYGSNWWRILYLDRVGYIRKNEGELQYADFNSYFRAEENLAIYDNRTGSLKKVGEINKGQVYKRVSDYGNWHRIQYGDIFGYVEKLRTSPNNGTSIKNKNENRYTSTNRDLKTLKNVTIYDNTSGSLVPFGTISKGQLYPVYSDYGNWWRIVLSDRVGYVSKADAKVDSRNDDQYFRAFKNIAVYDNRGSELEKIGELQKNQAFSIVSDYGSWWRVQFGDIYGYVRKADTGYATEAEIPNLNSRYSNSDSKFTSQKQIIVYDNSSGSLVAMGKIDENVSFPVATDYGKWWRIVYLDRVGYVLKEDVDLEGIDSTEYNITLREALEMQLNTNPPPQTDQRYAYVSKSYIRDNKVTASVLNVRAGAGTRYDTVGQLNNGDTVTILGEHDGWYQIGYNHGTWVNASSEDVLYYLDPNNFIDDERQKFQFLDLSRTSDSNINQLNNYLSGRGTLSGQGQAFKDASRIHGINDVYLISHAILETGHGSSRLAQGIEYRGVTVYNMYGIGAYDECPIECGVERAYAEGWTTPYAAIVGGAQFIGNNYIKAGQNTLYKMRWNPEGMENYGYATHQYATDIGWAFKQVSTMYNLYQSLNLANVFLDIPVYK